jgi:uncharacterized protein YkwD
MRRLPTLLAVLVAAALVAPSAALAADCQGADVRPAADNIQQVAQTTLCLLNAERAAKGLSAVSEQPLLTKASTAYSALMVSEKFFAHVSPEGSELTDRLTGVGYLGNPGSWIVGENIAWGESYLATPGSIVKAWMNSPPHRANILNGDYSDIGLGIAVGTPASSNPGATYTTDFGHREIEPDAPVDPGQGDITVGNGPSTQSTVQTGSHGATGRAPNVTPRAPRKAVRAGGCRRTARHARSTKGRASRVRCAGAWSAVQKHL